MPIRNTSKALVVHEGRLLLNRCRNQEGKIYYALPGGGQGLYESMEEAVAREVLEETGYRVKVVALAALGESIWMDPALRQRDPDYTHRVYHVFRCLLLGEEGQAPSEADTYQEGFQWVPPDQWADLPLYPELIREHLPRLVQEGPPLYLGTEYMAGRLIL